MNVRQKNGDVSGMLMHGRLFVPRSLDPQNAHPRVVDLRLEARWAHHDRILRGGSHSGKSQQDG
jgi:hypothetical protein